MYPFYLFRGCHGAEGAHQLADVRLSEQLVLNYIAKAAVDLKPFYSMFLHPLSEFGMILRLKKGHHWIVASTPVTRKM